MKLTDLKNKRKIIFSSIAMVIFAILFFITYVTIRFMENTIETTLTSDGSAKIQPIRFDFEKLKEIGIIK